MWRRTRQGHGPMDQTITKPRLPVGVAALLCLFLMPIAVAGAPATATAQEELPGPPSLGQGTELLYENCYEHVAAFRMPVSFIAGLVGSGLPTGFSYRTFDPAGTIGQLNVVGLDCDQGGHRVTDLLVNAVVNVPAAFARGLPTVLRVRTYTNSAETRARYGLFCFGQVRPGQVEASVEIDPVTGQRRGRVFASDGATSIELTTTTVPPPSPVIAAAMLQHFTVEHGQVRGLIEWGSRHDGLRRALSPSGATLELDGPPPPDVTVAGGQHVFPAGDGAPHTFFHRGLTACAPGLDGSGSA
jgi:hypothetical protein